LILKLPVAVFVEKAGEEEERGFAAVQR